MGIAVSPPDADSDKQNKQNANHNICSRLVEKSQKIGVWRNLIWLDWINGHGSFPPVQNIGRQQEHHHYDGEQQAINTFCISIKSGEILKLF